MKSMYIENELKMLVNSNASLDIIYKIINDKYYICPHENRLTTDFYFDYNNILLNKNMSLRIRKGKKSL